MVVLYMLILQWLVSFCNSRQSVGYAYAVAELDYIRGSSVLLRWTSGWPMRITSIANQNVVSQSQWTDLYKVAFRSFINPLRGVYSDTIQLNSTELNWPSWTAYTAKSVMFFITTSRPTNWVNCSRCRVEFSWVELSCVAINGPLDSKGNYSATSNNTKLVHWPLMGGLLHLAQRRGAWAGCGLAQSPPPCTKCNSPSINGQCTNHCIAIWWSVALWF